MRGAIEHVRTRVHAALCLGPSCLDPFRSTFFAQQLTYTLLELSMPNCTPWIQWSSKGGLGDTPMRKKGPTDPSQESVYQLRFFSSRRFSYFYSTRGRALARRPSGLASRPTLVHSKAATLSASPTARRGAALAPASGILMTSALRTRCTDAAVAGWLGAAGCVV